MPDVRLTEFALTGLAIDLEDFTTPTPARNSISRLDITVQNVSVAEAAVPVLLKLAVQGATGGTVAVEGSAVREPLAADLAVKVTSFPIAGATPYIEPLVNLRITEGAVSVEGRARLAGKVASFTGDVIVDKFSTVDGVKAEEFAGFTQLAIRGIDAMSGPLTANIAEIALTEPSARIAINADKTTNLAAILRTAAGSAPETTEVPTVALMPVVATTQPAPVWSLKKFTLNNGSVTLADRSIKPPARISLDQFSGTVTGLSSADLQRADVDIRGKLNGGGSIALTGKLDAKATTLAPGALTELTIEVKNVDLTPISPYIGAYAGYELTRSGLTVDVKTRLAQRKIDSTNVVTLNQFTLGAPTGSPQATKLPVRLGVALLKDSSGNIVIDLPVKGSLDDPNFKIGRVVMRVIVNLLVNAASSPFSLIGAAFGGGGDELAYQNFAAGAQTPLDTELAKIDTLRKALKGRPALNLDITGSFDPEADLAAVRDGLLTQQARVRLWEEIRNNKVDTPPPAAMPLPPEEEMRILGLFMAERFPAGAPAPASAAVPAGSVAVRVTVFKSVPRAGSVRMEVRRTQRMFAGRPPQRAPKPEPVKPMVLAATTDAAAAVAVANGAPVLTLADARRMLAEGIAVPPEELLKLADERARGVRAALLEGGEISEDRLFLTPPAPEGKGARVFLQLR